MFEEGIIFQKNIEKYQKRKTKEEEQEQERKNMLFHLKRRKAFLKSSKETVEKGIQLEKMVLDLLEELGFNRKAAGTIYLADVIETLYYEREIFEEENVFFDFDDKRNNHYSFTNECYECGTKHLVQKIEESKQNSYLSECSNNTVIYTVVNDIIDQIDPSAKKLVYKNNTK